MPMNLIEQQNQLRGLPDDALPREMQSGSIPPFLVLSEINRRKEARQRYEAQAAKYKGAQPTVAEELLGQLAPRGLDAAAMQAQQMPQPMAAPAPQGIDAALGGAPQGFANGGMVGGYSSGGQVTFGNGGLADILKIYQDRYAALGDPNKKALKQALMAIGAGMVSGGSSNFMKNVGAGLSAGVPVYQNALSAADDEAMKLLQLQANLTSDIEQQKLAEANAERDAKLDALRIKQAEAEAALAGLPPDAAAIIADANLQKQNPDLYQQMIDARLKSAEATATDEKTAKIDKIISTVSSKYDPIPSFTKEGMALNPEQVAAAREAQRRDMIEETFIQIMNSVGLEEAMDFKKRALAGLPSTASFDDDVLAGATPDNPVAIRLGSYGVDLTDITPENGYGQNNKPFWMQ